MLARMRRALAMSPPAGLSDEAGLSSHGAVMTSLAEAAVMVAITDAPDPAILLTLRPATMRAHAGQVALPGGRIDAADADAVAAALRETHEELGIPPAAFTVIGTGDPYVSASGFRIQPVVGLLAAGTAIHPCPHEVAAWFGWPARILLDPDAWAAHDGDWRGQRRRWYDLAERDGAVMPPHRIWGVTAGMLRNLGLRWTAAGDVATDAA